MRRARDVVALLCALTLVVVICGCGGSGRSRDVSRAKGGGGKPGGGGHDSTPLGTVYFRSADVTYTMGADGGNKTALPAGCVGEPSHQLGGNPLWFLKVANGQLSAVNATGTTDVPLIAQSDIDVRGSARWGPADEAASCVGLAPDGSSGGIYSVDIAWDPDGIPRPASAPVLLVSADPIPSQGQWSPAISNHDWSASGAIVHDLTSNDGAVSIRIDGVADPVSIDGHDPNWSPDGSLIAFVTDYPMAVYTMDASGGSRTRIIADKGKNPSTHYRHPHWAPTGLHLVCGSYERYGGGLDRMDVYRVGADGSAKTNLTSDIGELAAPVAWR